MTFIITKPASNPNSPGLGPYPTEEVEGEWFEMSPEGELRIYVEKGYTDREGEEEGSWPEVVYSLLPHEWKGIQKVS